MVMKIQNPTHKHLFRADLYRVLALGFEMPNLENLKFIQQLLKDLLESVLELEYFEPMENFLQDLLDHLPSEEEALLQEYHRLFGTHVACPSSEGSYQQVERGPIIGDISAFYEAFRMKVVERQGPPDSIKMELGFMSFMALKTVYALEHRLDEENTIVQEAQKKFLSSHLGRWIGCFCVKLRETTQNRFYQTLTTLLEQWILEDCKQMGVSPVPLQSFEMKDEGEVACSLGNQN